MRTRRRLADPLRHMARDLCLNIILASPLVPRPARWRLLKLLGARVEKSAISPTTWLGSLRLAIGHGTFINYGCRIDNSAEVTIGRNCSFGPDVALLTSSHEIGSYEKRAGLAYDLPIRVGDGVWLGARTTILPGISIGDGCIIAAGSVVTRDCEPGGLYAGVPAKRIKDLGPR